MPDRSERVKWLRDHPDEVKNGTRASVFYLLRKAGLISPKTCRYDVNIYNLVRDAGYPRRLAARYSVMEAARAAVGKKFMKAWEETPCPTTNK